MKRTFTFAGLLLSKEASFKAFMLLSFGCVFFVFFFFFRLATKSLSEWLSTTSKLSKFQVLVIPAEQLSQDVRVGVLKRCQNWPAGSVCLHLLPFSFVQ